MHIQGLWIRVELTRMKLTHEKITVSRIRPAIRNSDPDPTLVYSVLEGDRLWLLLLDG